MKRYQTMAVSDSYQVGIYDNCNTVIERRNDGNRLRITSPGVRWHGNTGSYHETVSYIDGRAAVRAYWRKLRKCQIRAIRNGDSPHNWAVLDTTYNW